jgi:hypothetical protein
LIKDRVISSVSDRIVLNQGFRVKIMLLNNLVAYKNQYIYVIKNSAMKKELITELFTKFEQACYDYQGIERWSARELQEVFGYTKWDNFQNVLDKAKEACTNAGEDVQYHFADIGKMTDLAKGAKRRFTHGLKCKQNCYGGDVS